MAGGIVLTALEPAALAIVSVTTGSQNGLSAIGLSVPSLGPYRSPQQNKPATYSITIPASTITTAANLPTNVGSPVGTTNGVTTIEGAGAKTTQTPSKLYVFDAIALAHHNRRLNVTRHPLQTGYNISDHAVLQEARVVLEIGMSDAMDSYQSGMWVGDKSKSVSCFQTLQTLMETRAIVTLTTRLKTYTNMIIDDVSAPETNMTYASLKATVSFVQLFIATVSSQIISARPNATGETSLATVQANSPSSSVLNQHLVTDLPLNNSNSVLGPNGVPVGGSFSSNNAN